MPRRQSRTRFEWDNQSSRFRSSSSGRFVSADKVRKGIDVALNRRAAENRALTQSLKDGAISLGQWREEMRASIKDSHLYAAAAARGGYSQLSKSDLGRAGALIREQYAFLEGFIDRIEAGKRLPQMLADAALYAQQARATYERTRRRIMQEENGMRFERSVLHGREHCKQSPDRPGCVEQAAKGWVPIGTLTPIGERTCLGNDLCTMRYSVNNPDAPKRKTRGPRIKPRAKRKSSR